MLVKRLQLLLFSLLNLLVGTLVYLFTRPPHSTYFLPEELTFYQHIPKSLLTLTGSLPSFCHIVGFSLLVLALQPNSKYISITCLFWLLVNILFELSQHSHFSGQLASISLPLLDSIKNYAKHGIFDLGDILAAILGSIVAYTLAKSIIKE